MLQRFTTFIPRLYSNTFIRYTTTTTTQSLFRNYSSSINSDGKEQQQQHVNSNNDNQIEEQQHISKEIDIDRYKEALKPLNIKEFMDNMEKNQEARDRALMASEGYQSKEQLETAEDQAEAMREAVELVMHPIELTHQFEEIDITLFETRVKGEQYKPNIQLYLTSSSPYLSLVYPQSRTAMMSWPLQYLQSTFNTYHKNRFSNDLQQQEYKENEKNINIYDEEEFIRHTNTKIQQFFKEMDNRNRHALENNIITGRFWKDALVPILNQLERLDKLQGGPHHNDVLDQTTLHFNFKINNIYSATRTMIHREYGNLYITVHYLFDGEMGFNNYAVPTNRRYLTAVIWESPIPENPSPTSTEYNWKIKYICPSSTSMMGLENLVTGLE